MKSLFIAEKPSVAQEFAKALKLNMVKRDGYLESVTSHGRKKCSISSSQTMSSMFSAPKRANDN